MSVSHFSTCTHHARAASRICAENSRHLKQLSNAWVYLRIVDETLQNITVEPSQNYAAYFRRCASLQEWCEVGIPNELYTKQYRELPQLLSEHHKLKARLLFLIMCNVIQKFNYLKFEKTKQKKVS